MRSVIFIETGDLVFAETLSITLGQWGLSVLRRYDEPSSSETLRENKVDVVLLDIRQQSGNELKLLSDIKKTLPDIDVILLNRADNIKASMAGMQAGADDEIIAPCDSGILKKKITEACRRRNKRLKKRGKRSLLDMFSDAMTAATFAQAGEFETAVDFLNNEPPDDADKKKQP